MSARLAGSMRMTERRPLAYAVHGPLRLSPRLSASSDFRPQSLASQDIPCCPRARRSSPMPGYILTGAPGAGKTAVLRLLETHGYAVVEEAATDVIALGAALGRDEPWRDPAFIDEIITLQRRRQDRVRAAGGGTVFYDRSPVCTLALSRYLRFPASPVLAREV